MIAFALPDRFWVKVDKSPGFGPWGDCWKWTAARSGGYGHFWLDGTSELTHRLSYMAVHGRIPPSDGFNGLCVCHRCDNPMCVNPDHLFLGEGQDNQNDKVAKRRHAHGKTHSRAKVDDLVVQQIRRAKGTNAEVALAFGVSPSTISYIRNFKTWKHVHFGVFL